MTSEAPHVNSPTPAVSVKARAKEIEARTQAAGKTLSLVSDSPVSSQEVASNTLYQLSSNLESEQATAPGVCEATSPSRRCSEGDIFQHCKARRVPPPLPPKQRRVSLENAPPPAVPERFCTLGRLLENLEGSSSGGLASATETTSKFAPFSGGRKSVVTCHKQATAAIFSPNCSLPAQPQHSPLDDIINALEKICDEFKLPDCANEGLAGHTFDQGDKRLDQLHHDEVLERVPETDNYSRRESRDVSEKTQWPSEHGIPQVEICQEDSTLQSFQSLNSFQGGHPYYPSEYKYSDTEHVIYRSTVQFSPKSEERHVVSATLQVSPPKIPLKCDSGGSTLTRPVVSFIDSEVNRPSIEKSLRFNNTTIVLETNDRKCTATTDSKLLVSEPTTPNRRSSLTSKSRYKCLDYGNKHQLSSKINSYSVPDKQFFDSVKSSFITPDGKAQNFSSGQHVDLKNIKIQSKTDQKAKTSTVALKPDLPKISNISSSSAKTNDQNSVDVSKIDEKDSDVRCPLEELEIVKNILANLDFEKYKRRYSLDDMEDKSPKPPQAQKSSSMKLKDFLDLLKPNSDTSSGYHKKHFTLCRSSSFSNASDKSPPTFFLQNEESDDLSPLPDGPKKTATLPRRKSPSRHAFATSPPMVAVASCPSIEKLDSSTVDPDQSDLTHDEGLVSDSEAGPCAYATAYVSCVTPASGSFSGRRGHTRSASDNVTSVASMPEVQIKKTLSTEKLWISVTSHLNGSKNRKRRKGVTSKVPEGSAIRDPVKSGTGRSLTYPPQRKCSASEEEQKYTSVDSNGLKSLKQLTAGLTDSGKDAVRLLSDLSLADSHLCPSEGTVDECYLDVVDSVMQSPNHSQHLSVEDHESSSTKPHKKKHHSDPGGEVCSSNPGEGFRSDSISSRSEPDLGGNEITIQSSSSTSSETSSRATQTTNERQHNLKLLIDDSKGLVSKHVRAASGGSLTSGAIPHSRFQFPDTDTNSPSLSSKSPQEQRRYSKRRLRGPYGEMLEEEMRKSGEKQKPTYSDLSFLCDSKAKAEDATSRPAMFLSSQSLDDASSTSSKNDLATPKRKISANYPLLTDAENRAIEDITAIKPQGDYKQDVDVVESSSENTTSTNAVSEQNVDKLEDNQGLSEEPKIGERHSVSENELDL